MFLWLLLLKTVEKEELHADQVDESRKMKFSLGEGQFSADFSELELFLTMM